MPNDRCEACKECAMLTMVVYREDTANQVVLQDLGVVGMLQCTL